MKYWISERLRDWGSGSRETSDPDSHESGYATRLRFMLVCFIYTFFCTHAWAETDKPNIVLFLVDAKGDARYALYDLTNDPSESNDLAAEKPEQLRSMMQGMVRELESRDAVYPVKDGQTREPVIPKEKRSSDK